MIRITALILGLLVSAGAFAAETGAITEGFACTLKPGKTMKDFDDATKFWSAQMDKMPDGDEQFVAVLTTLRANTPVDVYWLGTDANLNAWAKGEAAYEKSAEGAAAEANFDKVANCESGLWFAQTVYQGLAAPKVGDMSVIEGYQCSLKEGKTVANVEHANALWKAYVEQAKATDSSLGNFNAYILAPWLADTGYDLTYLVVNDSLADFAKINTAALTSPAFQPVQAAFDDAMSCKSGLFHGKVVRVPKTPAAQ